MIQELFKLSGARLGLGLGMHIPSMSVLAVLRFPFLSSQHPIRCISAAWKHKIRPLGSLSCAAEPVQSCKAPRDLNTAVLKPTSPDCVCGYLTDVEGNYEYFDAYVGISEVLEWEDPSNTSLRLKDKAFFVFGGDAQDKGAGDIRFTELMISLKRRYSTPAASLSCVSESNSKLSFMVLSLACAGTPTASACSSATETRTSFASHQNSATRSSKHAAKRTRQGRPQARKNAPAVLSRERSVLSSTRTGAKSPVILNAQMKCFGVICVICPSIDGPLNPTSTIAAVINASTAEAVQQASRAYYYLSFRCIHILHLVSLLQYYDDDCNHQKLSSATALASARAERGSATVRPTKSRSRAGFWDCACVRACVRVRARACVRA